jgi:hypothetical protein
MDIPTIASDEPAPLRPSDLSPTRLGGRYELADEIARGGMGVVYRAADTVLGREVAVKVLQDRFDPASPAARRFLDEARIAGQLQHPGIPAVHDLGAFPDGRPFLAMKLVRGQTLDGLLRARTDPSGDRGRFVAVFEQVCQAVGYAHEHRVIHRDLKPCNVMVGAFGEVQVMDWGLAKVLPAAGLARPDGPGPAGTAGTEIRVARDPGGSSTQAGSVLGTPAFMPPEQAGGAVEKVDERADVFGLGAILAVILTGQPPYVGADGDAVRLMAVRGQLADCLARLEGCGGEPGLVALCRRCLALSPADRPRDAGAVAREVAGLREAAEQRARAAELEQARAQAEAREQRKRRRVQVGLLLALGLLAAAVAAGLWRVDQQRRQGYSDKLQIVTTAVARLEQLRDQGREHPDYAATPEEAGRVLAVWERASFALEQAASLLAAEEAVDPSVAWRVAQLRHDIPAGARAAVALVKRTGKRTASLARARETASEGDIPAALRLARAATQQDPDAPDGHLLAGDLACRRGDWAAAAESYSAAYPLAGKYNPRLLPELEVRRAWARFVLGPGQRLLEDPKALPGQPKELCDLAELCLIAGYYCRSARLYERAFAVDPRAYPAHRATAALAATLGGCGLGKDRPDTDSPGRRRLRDLAARWLPTFTRPAKGSARDILASLIRLEGFDPAHYRFVRGVLPPFCVRGDWDQLLIPLTGDESNGSGLSIPGDRLVGSPYPGRNGLARRLAEGPERADALAFLNTVLPRHYLFDLACDAAGHPRGGLLSLRVGWALP